MRVVGSYSFNRGREAVKARYPGLLVEVVDSIKQVDARKHKTKVSKEKTMTGRRLFRPSSLNKAIKQGLQARGWKSVRVRCDYPTSFYEAD